MGDMLASAASWLGDVLRLHVSQLVEIRRGTQRAQVKASFGRTEWETIEAGGVVVRMESRDFGIQAQDYAFGASRVEPQRGDEIRWHDHGATYVYRVVPFGDEEVCFRYADRHRKRLRVYSEEVKTE